MADFIIKSGHLGPTHWSALLWGSQVQGSGLQGGLVCVQLLLPCPTLCEGQSHHRHQGLVHQLGHPVLLAWVPPRSSLWKTLPRPSPAAWRSAVRSSSSRAWKGSSPSVRCFPRGHSDVIAQDLGGHQGHRYALRRVPLAGHDPFHLILILIHIFKIG